jgi:hypothetical protein
MVSLSLLARLGDDGACFGICIFDSVHLKDMLNTEEAGED